MNINWLKSIEIVEHLKSFYFKEIVDFIYGSFRVINKRHLAIFMM